MMFDGYVAGLLTMVVSVVSGVSTGMEFTHSLERRERCSGLNCER